MASNNSRIDLKTVNNPLNNNRVNYCSNSVTNMVSNRNLIDCKCDLEFIQFCKIHTICHSDCFLNKKVNCDLCGVLADVKSIQYHISSERHRDRHQKLMEHVFLMSIPSPTHPHCKQLSLLLEKLYERISCNSFNRLERLKAVDKLNDLLVRNGLNEFMVRLYGSSINGFGLKNSDINIDLVMKSNENQTLEPQQKYESTALILSKVSDIIANDSRDFNSVRNDYNLKVPKVHFFDRQNRLECELSITAEKSYRCSRLLFQYSSIDRRAAILGTAFREWAHSYGFDDQENGLWPAFAFPVLAIHYLQRCSPPVLPCLHELFPRNPIPSDESHHQNSGVSHARHAFDDNESLEEEFNLDLLENKWHSLNDKPVGQLWLEMLRYYTVDFDSETFVVSIRNTHTHQTHRDKNWSTRMLAIEDPCRPSLNLSRSVGSMRLYNVFIDQLRHTYKYFAVPFVNIVPNNAFNNQRTKPLFAEIDFEVIVDQIDYYTKKFDTDLITQMSYVCLESNNDFDAKHKKDSDDSESEEENKRKEENFHLKVKRLLKKYGIRMVLSNEIETQIQQIRKFHIIHSFQLNRLPFFQKPPKYCRLCRRYSHQQNRCPEERLPDLIRLPDYMEEKHIRDLDEICVKIFFTFKMDKNDSELYNLIMHDLEAYLQKEMSNARLELFGSTKNGFGGRKCDLDICLTFSDNQTGENLEYAEIIEKVGQHLRYHRTIRNITPITSAKVPIVKFTFQLNQKESIDCDISLYNILARFNTQLLKTYCEIDERVQILGFIVKHFAKTCDICDASRGSLSSYAYILMTIHFLQQRGVIPVLQEIGLDQKQDRIIDGWNTWFFSDLNNLSKVWKPSPNDESVAELFLGFLRYYTEVFNYDESVVCCRQLTPLKRLEKMWTGRKIAIEDPFMLSHNLGAGVDNQMAAFIKTSIAKGRNIIGSPPHTLPQKYRDWSEYYFDRNSLTHGLPPTGRGCRTCGKIGHKQNKCPERPERHPNRIPNRRRQNTR